MAIDLIDTIKPKNNGTFPMVEAEDVVVGKGTAEEMRLPAALKKAGPVVGIDTDGWDNPADDRVPSTALVKAALAKVAKVYRNSQTLITIGTNDVDGTYGSPLLQLQEMSDGQLVRVVVNSNEGLPTVEYYLVKKEAISGEVTAREQGDAATLDSAKEYAKAYVDAAVDDKQDKLVAGSGISIAADGKTVGVSDNVAIVKAIGGASPGGRTIYVAGEDANGGGLWFDETDNGIALMHVCAGDVSWNAYLATQEYVDEHAGGGNVVGEWDEYSACAIFKAEDGSNIATFSIYQMWDSGQPEDGQHWCVNVQLGSEFAQVPTVEHLDYKLSQITPGLTSDVFCNDSFQFVQRQNKIWINTESLAGNGLTEDGTGKLTLSIGEGLKFGCYGVTDEGIDVNWQAQRHHSIFCENQGLYFPDGGEVGVCTTWLDNYLQEHFGLTKTA